MATNMKNPLLGVGLYSISEASALTEVHSSTIRRWVKGYHYKNKQGGKTVKNPLWQPDIKPIHNHEAINFMDLIEIRFVNAFHQHGVTWNVIRAAAEYAAELYHMNHPFANRKFKTDGKLIFEDTVNRLMDTCSKQLTFREIISPSLYASIEFSDNDIALRWFPDHKKTIVIDPQRSFGKPILYREGIPTRALAEAYKAEEDYKQVANMYDITLAAAKAAVDFESRLVA